MQDTFDPVAFGFVRLVREVAPDVAGYEFVNHPDVDGSVDDLRLSRDGDYCHVWWGMLDRIFTEARLALNQIEYGTVLDTYEDTIFKGYLNTEEGARHVFHALRIESRRYASPQVLSIGPRGLSCDLLQRRHLALSPEKFNG